MLHTWVWKWCWSVICSYYNVLRFDGTSEQLYDILRSFCCRNKESTMAQRSKSRWLEPEPISLECLRKQRHIDRTVQYSQWGRTFQLLRQGVDSVRHDLSHVPCYYFILELYHEWLSPNKEGALYWRNITKGLGCEESQKSWYEYNRVCI